MAGIIIDLQDLTNKHAKNVSTYGMELNIQSNSTRKSSADVTKDVKLLDEVFTNI